MTKYKYRHEVFKELVTKITENPKGWIEDRLNEVGARGERIVGFPVEFQEASPVRDSAGNAYPYYCILVLVETPYEDDGSPI